MTIVVCSVCHKEFDFGKTDFLQTGNVTSCPLCGADLLIRSVSPLILEPAKAEQTAGARDEERDIKALKET